MRIRLQATPPQRAIIESRHPEQILVAGRRWGKTFTVRNKILGIAAAIACSQIWYVSPTYSLGFQQYKAFLNNRHTRQLIKKPKQQPYPQFQWKWGGEVGFRSADRGDNLRGDGLDAVFCDEAAYLDKDFIDEVVRPTLADKRGLLFLTSTFRGENWFYDLWKEGQTPNKDVISWKYPTPTGIAFQSPKGRKDLERQKRRVAAAVWEQEWLCEPNANLCAAFKFVGQCVTPGRPPGPGKGPYVLGWDTGKASDPSGIVVLDTKSGQVVHAECLPIGMGYDKQLESVSQIAKHWKALVIIDSTGAGTKDAIVDFARSRIDAVIGVQFKGRYQEEYVKQVDIAMQQGDLKIPAQFDQLVSQLKLYEYQYFGRFLRYGAQQNEHDDLVAALCMAWWARVQNWARDGGRPVVDAIT